MTLSTRDKAVLWHPYTQHQTASLPLPILRGEGAYLYGEDEKEYLDLISSWWVNLHGHSHPAIAKAIYEQAMTLEHVLFAGCTHEPAVKLAENVLQLLPSGFSKVFYSDNGSTAVEVALKMAYQYWHNQGQSQRKRYIAFERGYHGDTFGAMSLSKQSGFFNVFDDLLFKVDTIPYPATWVDDPEVVEKEQHVLAVLDAYLNQHALETAALILEPLVQGASGMRMCTPRFLRALEKLTRQHDVLIIYDEVMTGFGRTGADFAAITAKTTPDIICLAKGLTGGFLPLAMTVCHERLYQAFLGNTFSNAFAHGHSYTANPLGCAAGIASLTLLQHPDTKANIAAIENVHKGALSQLRKTGVAEKVRYSGTIAAFDLTLPADYGSTISQMLQTKFLAQGLLLRPLGNVIYLLPPYCITAQALSHAYDIVINVIEGIMVC